MASELPPGTDLCAIPAGMPPDGTVPNLVDPPSLAPALIAVSAVLTAWSLLFTAGRFYVNIKRLKWADYFVIIAFALNVTYTGLILAMEKFSRHQWDIPACWFDVHYLKVLYAQGTILGPVIFFAKSAILLLYLQIFKSNRTMRGAVQLGLVITFLTYWPGVGLEAYFAAPHPDEQWEDLYLNGRPERLIYWGIVQGSLAVLIDIYIFVLPLPLLSRLHISARRKIALLGVFFTALMGVVASAIALVYRVNLLTTEDLTWANTRLFICVIVENNVAIIVGSSPAFATFIRVHVSESTLVKSLRSKLALRSSGQGSGSTVTPPQLKKGQGIAHAAQLNNFPHRHRNPRDQGGQDEIPLSTRFDQLESRDGPN